MENSVVLESPPRSVTVSFTMWSPAMQFLLFTDSMTFSGEMRACLYDVSGNLVLDRKVTASLHKAGELDLSKVDGGSYTLKLSCNNKTITKNIIKL